MRKRVIHLKRLVQGEGHRAGTHTSAVPAGVLRAVETRAGPVNTSVVDLQQNRHGLQYKNMTTSAILITYMLLWRR